MSLSSVQNYDLALRNKAIIDAERDTNYNKRSKIIRNSFLAVPAVAGVVSAVNSPKLSPSKLAILDSKFFEESIIKRANSNLPYVKGAAARALNGLKSAGNLYAYIAAGLLAYKASDKIAEKSDKYKHFIRDNSFVNWVAVGVAGIGMVMGAKKGIGALMKKVKPETMERMFTNISKKADAFNDLRPVKALSEFYNKQTGKMSEQTQNILKTVIGYLPLGIICGSTVASFANNANFMNKARGNYENMLEKDVEVARAELEK